MDKILDIVALRKRNQAKALGIYDTIWSSEIALKLTFFFQLEIKQGTNDNFL